MPEVVLHFGHSRASGGEDVAALVREQLPAADVRAVLGEDGALTGYTLTLHFEDGDVAVEAAFRICEFLRELGVRYEVPDA